MKQTHQIILTLLLSFTSLFSYGQLDNILELSCSNDYPKEGDSITINYTYGFPYQPCTKDSTVITTINNSHIQIDAYYSIGIFASPCSDNDSINIKELAINIDKIVFNIYSSKELVDTDSIVFDINGTTSINNELQTKTFKIFPNPTKNKFSVLGVKKGSTLNIYNTLGQKVKSIDIIKNNQTINISDFKKGIYIIKVYNSKKLINEDKIVLQ